MPHFYFPSLVLPEKLVELIRRDYKGAVLCPFPWCEDELQLKLSNIFTRLQIFSRRKERSQLTDDNVNMTEIFKSHPECDNPRVVLIEGNPGMGKTTYCQKLAHDWSVGEIPPDASFPEVEILLLLKCRDMHMKTANIEEAIDDQLLPQDAGKKEKEDFFHFIRSNQSKILLILDGLDELRQELLPSIQQLIQGKIFSNTFLVLTARHEEGIRLRRYCDTLLEITGYTNDDVDSYVKKYFSKHENQSLAEEMIQQLKINTELRELTANPLNTALLCLLCEETNGIFPSSRTKIYDDLVSCALRRYFTKRGVPLSDDDPLERCSNELNQLGETAFEALLKNQLYFSRDDQTSESTDFLQLPFLSREPSLSKIRPKPCYAFTHKTFQEYFAAFYLAKQIITGNKEKAQSLLAKLSPVDNWQVWEFIIPIVSSKSSEMAVFVISRLCSFFFQERPHMTNDGALVDADRYFEVCERKPSDWTISVDKWNDNEKVLDDVVTKTLHVIKECEENESELKDYQRKMVRVLAKCFPVRKLSLGQLDRYYIVYSEYLRTNSTLTDLCLNSTLNEVLLATVEGVREKDLKHLNLLSVNTDFLFLKLCSYPYLKEDSEYSFSSSEKNRFISSFTQHQSWIKNFGARELGKCLQSFRHLTHLKFRGDFICSEGAEALAEVIRASHSLTHLSLRNAGVHDLEAIVIGKALQSNCTLTHLTLAGNQIDDLGAIVLANSLNSNRSLQYVDLSDNDVGDSGAQELARVLRSNSSLTFLDLSNPLRGEENVKPVLILDSDSEIHQHFVRCDLIGASGASSLARALRSNRSLTYLDLSFNEVGKAGAAALGEALQSNCTLSHLFLCSNAIGDSGTAPLGEGLQSNCSLSRLYLTENGIGDPGAEALGKAMQSNHSLTHLNLQVNLIGDLGAAALASALESTGIQLTHLDLALNKISCVGAEALAKALESNSSLKALELGSNAIGSSGASSFGKALRSNRTLTHLIVTTNNITESGAVELVDALLINNSLICLNVEDNPISSLEAENLKRDIQSHCVIFL